MIPQGPTGKTRPRHTEVSLDEALATAVRLHRSGRLEAALEIYRRILAACPDHPDALHFLGVLSHQLGKSQEAADLIRQVIALKPDHLDAYNNLGNVLKHQGKLEEAAAAYRHVIALCPDHADAHNNLGTVLRAQDRLDDAIAAYQTAITLAPDHADAYLNLGNAYKKQGKVEETIAAYLKTLALKRYASDAYKNLGTALYVAGRVPEAAAVYRIWLYHEPDHPAARHMLAACSGQDVPPRASDAYVQTLFNRFADSFDDQLASLDYRAPELVAQVVADELGAAERQCDVLDAGCGTGLCGPLLRPYARRLTGVDLSPAMIEKARARQVYDALIAAELTEHLQQAPARYDLVVSADALVYFGDLQPVFAAVATALRSGGRLVLTVEQAPDAAAQAGFRINPHGRYSHTEMYLRQTLTQAGLNVRSVAAATLRKEHGEPVAGAVVLACKS